ncbi:adenosine deaminase family protein [Vallitalea longa]|uniref:Adenosine deaminase family protein n=1 Tax=Vallitalea longa TaxID=2936439 RepID=A0A9W6DF58_9FIRM|nr:adenosine deaminase [Vallitalea longa]GKX30886.1 adenosine deaminase family protein [Vallitalea longa]
MKEQFISYLQNNDIDGLKKISKSDLHNHATRGGNIDYVVGSNITKTLPIKFNDLNEMQEWYNMNIKPHCIGKQGFIKRIEGAFLQAKEDGVSVLTLSFGIGDKIHFNNSFDEYIENIEKIKEKIFPQVLFIPEISMGRTDDIKPEEYIFDEILSLDYFKAIDLVGDDTQPVDNYKNIYKKAKNKGMILKAHVGEFGDAESVRKAVDMLELDQVQHGINAVNSVEIMKWLAANKVQLNICPTSNVMLNRVNSYETHPIVKLFSYGIPVTINTDDMLIFNQSVSNEYLNLYNRGILSAEELNEIREKGLSIY